MAVELSSVHMEVRSYEIDPQHHVNGSVYQQYADHSRFACVRAAGIDIDELLGSGFGPVNLETVIRYHNELRGGDEVDVSCAWIWGEGKTYRVEHVLRRGDGEIAAEVQHVSGLLDLKARRLTSDPATQWRSRAKRPELLGFS
ncbi:acyl-CoA thioesterase [Streptomyces sp. KR80]|uniref:acyl-CoA thioesterase n=1 Tax=Streptomyces sp. KR80 TaxID=3457426 RepID=UPI003FD3B2DD